MKGQLSIENMYAFVVTDDDGTEGVIGFQYDDGNWMPMVGADLARVDQLRPIAQDMATALGKEVRLYKFSERETTERIQPGGGG